VKVLVSCRAKREEGGILSAKKRPDRIGKIVFTKAK